MLKDVEWSEDRAYGTDSDDEPVQFYLDALSHSKKFDLLLGYFSSAAINVLSLGFAKFLSSGGTVRIIANNVLSKEDKEVIASSINNAHTNVALDLSDIKSLKRSLDEYGTHFFECLSWLFANKKIDFKLIRPKKGKGIAHYKSGVFYDGAQVVGFKASCNFTAYGLLENLEELECFLSWENGRSNKLINRQAKKFNQIFAEEADFVEYLNIDDVVVAVREAFGDKSINELLIQEKELAEKKKKLLSNKKTRKSYEMLVTTIETIAREPRFPYPAGPRPYQIEAYENWCNNNCQGIFAMATGTGKTITSLNCLLNESRSTGNYKAVIVVPTVGLLEQWKKECLKFNFRNIITVSSHENWNDDLAFFNTANKLIDSSFIVIVTYASLIKPRFQAQFQLLSDDTVLIADEVHNMGSPSVMRILPSIHLRKRIGLSATPNRQYDEEGNEALSAFFNDKFPYVYSYTMKQALDIGWLCKYTYYPHLVFLNDKEQLEYTKLSKRLLAFIDSHTGKYKDCPEVEEILLLRKQIIHKAANKKEALQKVLKREFKSNGNIKYTLVYVPEGSEANYEHEDLVTDSADDLSLIDDYTTIVKETDDSVMVKQYTSKTPNRPQVIADFEKGLIHVLTSMKCLDEGVDVPQSKVAVFCASTGNPRQFIQRRGRVLRKHENKVHAIIHDLVVAPKVNPEEDTFAMERNLLRKELQRVVDFSELSMNPMDAYNELKDVLDYYNLSLYDLIPN